MACLLAIMLPCSPARAQSAAANGAISGTVTDPQGKIVRGAKIIVRNTDLAFERTVETNENGNFDMPLLPPGTYAVGVEAQGFILARPLRVTVSVGSSVRLILQLSLAGTSQHVTVHGRAATVEGNTVAPAVNKQEAETSNFIAGLTDTYLPNRDRDFSQFDQLAAGTAPNANGTELSIAGQRTDATKTAVDGADFDDPLEGRQRGAEDDALFFPQTVVREFNIVHAGAGADVGGTNAGFVNVVTKEGSDKLHGEALYTGRPPWLTSNDAFGHALDNEQSVFGGSLGGPIKRGKAFFYVGAEQDFLDVPYWTEFQAQAPSVVVPAALTSQQQQIVEANHPTALFGRSNVLLDSKNTLNLELDFNRIRATNINEDASTRTDATQSDGMSLSGQSVWLRGGLATAMEARTANQFLAQWASDRRDFTPNSAAPEVVINGFGALGGNGLGLHRYTSDTRELNDDLAISRGTGLFRVGADFAYDPGTEEHEANPNGRFDFNSLADYLADNPRRYQQTFASGDAIYSGAVRQLGWYASYKWALMQRLTLTAGLRWDAQWNPQPSNPNPAIAHTNQIPNDLTEWQPRLGVAWNPATNTVVRFSSGLYDAPTPATTFQRVFTDNGLNTVVADSYYDPQILPLLATPNLVFRSLAVPPPGLTTPEALVVGISPDFRNPRSFQFSGSVEQQLGRKVNVTAGYLRDSTWDLPVLLNLNLETPMMDSQGMPIFPAARPDPAVGQLLINESAAHSSYDGLLLTGNFQLSRRTQIVANYTLSHTRDNSSDDDPFGITSVLDPFDLATEAADSSFDMRNEFNVSALFWLPLGFKIDPIFVAHSGLPYTPLIGLDTQNDGDDFNDRAIINGMVAGRNSLRQPAFCDLDFRVVKDITLPGAGHHLDLFMDIFNITGADNFDFGPNGISIFGMPTSPVFTAGQALFAPDTAHFGGAREVQFTARLVAF
ncbi:MAG: carboxypeptidase regulatory-like domain-containing protein [Candidatus Acidiferrales bacterium]